MKIKGEGDGESDEEDGDFEDIEEPEEGAAEE